MNSRPIYKTHVYHEDGRVFFVSTIERDSSAIGYPTRYWETLAWECDPKTAERMGGFIYQGDGWDAHFRVCKLLEETGKPTKDEE